mmetsp:Transcript_97171/g.261020  ORF Transcript_97171/g.261020 Transcript_97171/m.261020 type:complete len:636 (-) Transcript_97171:73-1980(-)
MAEAEGGAVLEVDGGGESVVCRSCCMGPAGRRNDIAGQETACQLLSPVWAVSLRDLLAMTELMPHADLQAKGIVVEWKRDSGRRLVFVSHQWVSWRGPDPNMRQFSVLQKWLRRVMDGTVKRIEGDLLYQLLFQRPMLMNTKDFATGLEESLFWYDYFSIPQPANSDSSYSDMESFNNAVNSIPAFVELSSYFIVICPPVMHEDTGVVCDKASWMSRGWCLLEGQSRELASKGGAVIVVMSETSCHLMNSLDTLRAPVGTGSFSCCAMNHQLDGKPLPCDKLKVAGIVRRLHSGKLMQLERDSDEAARKLMLARRSMLLRGLPPPGTAAGEGETGSGDQGAPSVERWLEAYKLSGVEDGLRTGFTALRFACIEGNAPIARALIEARASLEAPTREDVPDIFHPAGSTILHSAAMFNDCTEIMKLLIDARADPFSKNSLKNTPMYTAIAGRNTLNLKWLLDSGFGSIHDRNGYNLTPLINCGLFGAQEAGIYLIEAGSDVNAVNDGGACAINDTVVSNSPELCSRLLDARADINHQVVPSSILFRAIFGVSNGLRIFGNSLEFFQIFGHAKGCTPLMWCALFGRAQITDLLLKAGADTAVRNCNGYTAMELAKERGFMEIHAIHQSWTARRGLPAA